MPPQDKKQAIFFHADALLPSTVVEYDPQYRSSKSVGISRPSTSTDQLAVKSEASTSRPSVPTVDAKKTYFPRYGGGHRDDEDIRQRYFAKGQDPIRPFSPDDFPIPESIDNMEVWVSPPRNTSSTGTKQDLERGDRRGAFKAAHATDTDEKLDLQKNKGKVVDHVDNDPFKEAAYLKFLGKDPNKKPGMPKFPLPKSLPRLSDQSRVFVHQADSPSSSEPRLGLESFYDMRYETKDLMAAWEEPDAGKDRMDIKTEKYASPPDLADHPAFRAIDPGSETDELPPPYTPTPDPSRRGRLRERTQPDLKTDKKLANDESCVVAVNRSHALDLLTSSPPHNCGLESGKMTTNDSPTSTPVIARIIADGYERNLAGHTPTRVSIPSTVAQIIADYADSDVADCSLIGIRAQLRTSTPQTTIHNPTDSSHTDLAAQLRVSTPQTIIHVAVDDDISVRRAHSDSQGEEVEDDRTEIDDEECSLPPSEDEDDDEQESSLPPTPDIPVMLEPLRSPDQDLMPAPLLILTPPRSRQPVVSSPSSSSTTRNRSRSVRPARLADESFEEWVARRRPGYVPRA